MDPQIQSIIDQALTPQSQISKSGQKDPISSILENAGVSGQPTETAQATNVPEDVTNATAKIGDPMDKGYCETFVEKMANLPNMGPTAKDAWDNFAASGKANPDVSHAPGGSLIYFAPDQSNGEAGHVAITDGNGNIIGATYNGVEQYNLSDWMRQTGQKPLGYVIP